MALARVFGMPSVSKMITFWAPLRPRPPAIPVGKAMGELVTNVRKVVSDVGVTANWLWANMRPMAKQVPPLARGVSTKLAEGTAFVAGSASYGVTSVLLAEPSALIVEKGKSNEAIA